MRPGANASRCAILVREQRKSREPYLEFRGHPTAFPLLPDENGGRRRPRAGFGIPVYLCVLRASVVHYYQFLISMNDDEAVAGAPWFAFAASVAAAGRPLISAVKLRFTSLGRSTV